MKKASLGIASVLVFGFVIGGVSSADAASKYKWEQYFTVDQGKTIRALMGKSVRENLSKGDDDWKETVSGKSIKNGAINGSKIKDGAVTTAKVADSTITSAKVDSSVAKKIVITGKYVNDKNEGGFSYVEGGIDNDKRYYQNISIPGISSVSATSSLNVTSLHNLADDNDYDGFVAAYGNPSYSISTATVSSQGKIIEEIARDNGNDGTIDWDKLGDDYAYTVIY